MFELKTSMFGSLRRVISPFQECQHSKFPPVQEKPERFWLLNRRKTSGFRSVAGTQPQEKRTKQHFGTIMVGVFDAATAHQKLTNVSKMP